jgi:hypothetical protein
MKFSDSWCFDCKSYNWTWLHGSGLENQKVSVWLSVFTLRAYIRRKSFSIWPPQHLVLVHMLHLLMMKLPFYMFGGSGYGKLSSGLTSY